MSRRPERTLLALGLLQEVTENVGPVMLKNNISQGLSHNSRNKGGTSLNINFYLKKTIELLIQCTFVLKIWKYISV
jgi:hypothetical protein